MLTDWQALENRCDRRSASTCDATSKTQSVDTASCQKTQLAEEYDISDETGNVKVQTTDILWEDFPSQIIPKVQSGTWQYMDDLAVHDIVKTPAAFLSFDRKLRVQLPKDIIGVVKDVDDDGDALIYFAALRQILQDSACWVQTDFEHLSKLEC